MAIPHRNGRGGSLMPPSLGRPLVPRTSLRGEEPAGSCAQSAHCGLRAPWSCRNDIHACLIRHPAVNRCCKAPRDRTAMKPVLDTGSGLCLIDSIRPGWLGLFGQATAPINDDGRNLLKNRREKTSAWHTHHTRISPARRMVGGWRTASSASVVPPLRRSC